MYVCYQLHVYTCIHRDAQRTYISENGTLMDNDIGMNILFAYIHVGLVIVPFVVKLDAVYRSSKLVLP